MHPEGQKQKTVLSLGFLVLLGFLFPFSSVLLLSVPTVAAETGSETTLSDRTWSDQFSADGHLLARYTYRTTESNGRSETDKDLWGQLRLDAATADTEKYELHLLGNFRLDLDGDQDRTGFFPFEGVADTSDATPVGYLYDAHFAVNFPVKYVAQVRIGRQPGTRGELVFFDGLAADLRPFSKLRLVTYGGVSVHHYDLNRDWGSDWLFGLGGDYSLSPRTLVSLDYLHTEDENENAVGSSRSDDFLAAKVWYRFLPTAKTSARLTFLNDGFRDIRLRGLATILRFDVEVSGTYYLQFKTLDELTHEFAPLYDIMGESRPFHSLDLKFRKFFGEKYAIDLGLFHRALLDDSDEGPFNREYSRVFGDFQTFDLLFPGIDLVLTGEHWATGETEFNSAGFDLGYRFDTPRKGEIHGGTEFSLYQYDYYIDRNEKEKVRTYFLDGALQFGGGYSARVHYAYEDFIEDVQTLKLEVRYVF